MHHDRIDDSFRDKLKFYPSPIDTDRLRRRIEQSRDHQPAPQGRRKRGLLILLASFLAGALSCWVLGVLSFAPVTGPGFSEQSVPLSYVSDKRNEKSNSNSLERERVAKSLTQTENDPVILKKSSEQVHNQKRLDKAQLVEVAQLEGLPDELPKQLEKAISYTTIPTFDFLHVLPVVVRPENEVELFPEKVHFPGIESLPPKSRTSISLSASPAIALKKLNGQSKKYLKQRQLTEQRLEAWSVGLRYQIDFNSGLLLSLGLTYQQLNERLFWEHSRAELVKKDGLFYRRTLQRSKTHYNNLKYLYLPVLVGYQSVKNRWQWGVQAGAMINLLQKAKGQIVSPDLEPRQFVSMDEHIFKKQIAPAILLRLSIGYYLSPHVKLALAPGLQIQSSSITKPEFGIAQRYHLIHAALTVNWELH